MRRYPHLRISARGPEPSGTSTHLTRQLSGTHYDVFRRVGGELKLAERRCVYDNLLVPNALCIPV